MRLIHQPGPRRMRARLATFSAAVVAAALVPALAFAGHTATLAGSNFEIDNDANLTVEHLTTDWGNLAHPDGPEVRATDKDTGRTDDSYKGGVKEDTECPDEVTGSIPNNKSDLLTFHTYEEPGQGGHPGFFNMAWSRVSDPSGTTLMDFEFNQSTIACEVGPNKERTEGDLLIEYSIVQGGARAELTARSWDDTAKEWRAPEDIDEPNAKCPDGSGDPAPCAAGTINSSTIQAGDSDGLGEKQPRTFGEAQLDLRYIFDEGECTSFGSAMVKSRSSDSFTSQLKDFITPVPITLQNCGQVIIHKQTDPDGATASFGYTKSFNTDPETTDKFTLQDDGTQDYKKTVLFGSNYTVTEDVIPTNWVFVRVDCDASKGVTPTISGKTVTFDIDADTDVLECTYYNKLNQGAIEITKTRKHAADGSGDHPHAGVDFTVTGGSLPSGGTTVKTDANGKACIDGLAFADNGGTSYEVAESVPSGYVADGSTTKSVTVDNTATCSDDPYGGEKVSFSNTPLTNVTVSVDSQVDGGTASTIKCVDGSGGLVKQDLTNAPGDVSLEIKDLKPMTLVCTIVIDP